jgi:tetratricopeptide (TPR) repeat protein
VSRATCHALAALGLAATLAGCAGAPPAPPPRPAAEAGPARAPRPDPAAQADEARRRFEAAAQAQAEAERGRAPDWAVLEQRWRLVLADGEVAEARYNLGLALERQGRLAEAREAYQQALAQKPLRQAAVNLGVLLEREGDGRGAAAAYAGAARDFPEDAVARARLGALYRQSGQLDEAWRLSREALLRDPANVLAYRTMIRVALGRNDPDLAKLVALRAQKVAPDDPEVAWLAGQVAAKAGDEAAAAAQWKRALEKAPGFLPARAGLLELAVRHERWPEVAEQARALLADDPANAAVQLVRGVADRHLGKPDEALEAYQAAERLAAGRLPEVHLARGILLMRDRADCAGAVQSFDRYEKAVGPVLPQGSPVPRLLRECQEQLEQGRQAAEAARQMQADAERKAAEAAARKAAEPPAPADAGPAGKGPAAGAGAAPTPAPAAGPGRP